MAQQSAAANAASPKKAAPAKNAGTEENSDKNPLAGYNGRNRVESFEVENSVMRASEAFRGAREAEERSRESFSGTLIRKISQSGESVATAVRDSISGGSKAPPAGEKPTVYKEKHIGDSEDNEPERQSMFELSHGLTTAEAKVLLDKYGRNELPEKKIPKWYIFVSQLWQPMPIMIWLAACVELGIANYIDMSILLMIQFANASIGYYEITKAGDAVAALKKSLKPTATAKRDGKFNVIDAALLVPGDLVLLASGSAVPADCRVNEGEIEVDEAALTGESLPVAKFQMSSCKMGSTVVRGEVEGTVEFTGADTFFGKTAALLGVSSNSDKVFFSEILRVLNAIPSLFFSFIFFSNFFKSVFSFYFFV
jgi:magnesium-transporting ATPase (P-type)